MEWGECEDAGTRWIMCAGLHSYGLYSYGLCSSARWIARVHECVRKEFAGAVLMAYILKIYIVMVVRKGFTGTIRMACTVYGLYSYGLNGYGREERVRRDRTCNLPCSIPCSGRMQPTMHQPYSTTCSMRATHHASSMQHGMHRSGQRTVHHTM